MNIGKVLYMANGPEIIELVWRILERAGVELDDVPPKAFPDFQIRRPADLHPAKLTAVVRQALNARKS